MRKSNVVLSGKASDVVEFLKDCTEVFGNTTFESIMTSLYDSNNSRTRNLIHAGYGCKMTMITH